MRRRQAGEGRSHSRSCREPAEQSRHAHVQEQPAAVARCRGHGRGKLRDALAYVPSRPPRSIHAARHLFPPRLGYVGASVRPIGR